MAFPVKVSKQICTVLGAGQVPTVKVHYGRLGKFLPASDVPAFDTMEAWFKAELKRGKWVFHEQVPEPNW